LVPSVAPASQRATGEEESPHNQLEKTGDEAGASAPLSTSARENATEPVAEKSPQSDTPVPWANKLFKETSKDFGHCTGDQMLIHRFEMTNLYAVPIEVTGVNASCGCVTWTLGKQVLQPRENDYLEVRMDPKRFSGAKTVTIHVTVGPMYVSTATITLTAQRSLSDQDPKAEPKDPCSALD
jgi:hypothetical protein